MKKRFSLFLVAILSIFALVACSNFAKGDQPQKQEPQKELTVTEVLNKMIENSQNQSLKMEGTIGYKFGQVNDKFTMTSETTPNPAAAHFKMSYMGMEVEMYVDDQFVYAKFPDEPKWVKMPVTAEAAGVSDPMKQFEEIKPLINSLGANKEVGKLEKANGQYIATLDLAKLTNDPAVRQLATQFLSSNADPQKAQQMQQVLQQLKFDKFKVVYHVDEKTFEMKKYIVEMNVGAQGQTIEYAATFDVSKLEQNVTIPEEVKQAETLPQTEPMPVQP